MDPAQRGPPRSISEAGPCACSSSFPTTPISASSACAPGRSALTALLTCSRSALVGARGLNLGVDFVGGLMIEAKFPQPPPLDKRARRCRPARRRRGARCSSSATPTPSRSACRCPKRPTKARPTRWSSKVKAALSGQIPGVDVQPRRHRVGQGFGRADPATACSRSLLAVLGIASVRLVPLRMAVRRLDLRRDRPRRADDARLLRADPARVRPQHRRRGADDHRLFDQRQDRHRRPHPREYAQISQDGHARADRPVGQRDAAAHRDDLADDPARARRAADLRRPRAARLHRGDDPRHRRRHLFVDLRLVARC